MNKGSFDCHDFRLRARWKVHARSFLVDTSVREAPQRHFFTSKKKFHREGSKVRAKTRSRSKTSESVQSDSPPHFKNTGARMITRRIFAHIPTRISNFAKRRVGGVRSMRARLRARASCAAVRSPPVDWPCRRRPSSPARRTSRWLSGWTSRRRPCPGSCRRSRRPLSRSRPGR